MPWDIWKFLSLPWLLLLEKCSEEEKEAINTVIEGKKPAGMSESAVKTLSDKYNLPEMMNQTIQEHYNTCKAALESVNDFDDTELQIFLEFVIREFSKISDQK